MEENLHLAYFKFVEDPPSVKKCIQPSTFGTESWKSSTFFCVRPFMDQLNNLLGIFMKGRGKCFCLAFHGILELRAWGLHKSSQS